MTNKPILNPQQKMELLLELTSYTSTNHRITSTNTSSGDAHGLITHIVNDNLGQYEASGGTILIIELKKSGILWDKIRPFIHNSADTCGTKGCGHRERCHTENNCAGTDRVWIENGKRPAAGEGSFSALNYRRYDERYGSWKWKSCEANAIKAELNGKLWL